MFFLFCFSFMSNGQKSSAEKTFSLPSKTTAPYIQGVRHLLDDSVLEESPCASSDGSICGKILPGQYLNNDPEKHKNWFLFNELKSQMLNVYNIQKVFIWKLMQWNCNKNSWRFMQWKCNKNFGFFVLQITTRPTLI